ncbi:MAG: dTMP kinase [Pseudomonadota bacterium]
MNRPRKGRLITLEGGEGAGKSTNVRVVEKTLRSAGVNFVSTREPGGTQLAETLRGILLNPEVDVPPYPELLMIFAARFDHVEKVIVPALNAGRWVICDRFVDASFAYQGGGRGLPWEHIRTLERWLPNLARPALTLLLDVPPGKGLKRATRSREADRFERENAEFYQRIREAYLKRAARGRRYRVINAAEPRRKVGEQVREAVLELLQRTGVSK